MRRSLRLLLAAVLIVPAVGAQTFVLPPDALPAPPASLFFDPQAAVSTTELVFVIDPDGTAEAQSFTLSNVAEAGAEALLFTAFSRKIGGDGLLGHSPDGSVVLTQSLSQDIVSGYASVCNLNATASYWRVFDLADTDLTGEFAVSEVQIGIAATPPLGTTLRLYRLDGSLRFGTLTLLAEVAVPLDGTEAATLLSVPVEAALAADAQLAVEWNTPFVPDVGPFFGTNPSGETRPRYQSYPGCFSTDFPPIEQPSADTHWVLNVVGSAGPAPFTVTPGSGLVSAGDSTALTVAVDAAGLEEGVHPYEIVVLTNDPEAPRLTVAVSVEVLARTVATEADAPSALAVEPVAPNPTSGATSIVFTLAEATAVRLTVFDATGRQVAVLLDGPLAAGRHQATWRADGLAAGTYVVRMQAGDTVQTLRAVVAR